MDNTLAAYKTTVCYVFIFPGMLPMRISIFLIRQYPYHGVSLQA